MLIHDEISPPSRQLTVRSSAECLRRTIEENVAIVGPLRMAIRTSLPGNSLVGYRRESDFVIMTPFTYGNFGAKMWLKIEILNETDKYSDVRLTVVYNSYHRKWGYALMVLISAWSLWLLAVTCYEFAPAIWSLDFSNAASAAIQIGAALLAPTVMAIWIGGHRLIARRDLPELFMVGRRLCRRAEEAGAETRQKQGAETVSDTNAMNLSV